MAVYEILEEVAQKRNLSIADISKICNLPDSTVRGIFRRKQETIALEVAFKISDGLGISLERLNGMPEKSPIKCDTENAHPNLDDSNIVSKNSPGAAEAEPGEDAIKLYNYINQGLVSLGFIWEDDAEILIGICRIIKASFDQ